MKKIINVAPWSQGEWTWLQGKTPALSAAEWQFFSAYPVRVWERFAMTERISRIRTCWQAARAFRRGETDIIVTHGPFYALWVAFFLPAQRKHGQFLAFSFNFTEMPGRWMLRFMRQQFQKIDRFTTYSTLEVGLYADIFGIPREKIDMIHWGANPPSLSDIPPVVEGNYIAAIGGEGRDYATLVEAARRMSNYRFVIVARENSLVNLAIPDNVTCYANLPLAKTMNVLAHASISVIPLRTSRTPCGHVTIVAGMHLGKAQVVTRSEGVANYIEDGKTGVYALAGDAADLQGQMTRLMEDDSLRSGIASGALRFAQEFCAESTTVRYFDNIVVALNGSPH